LLYQNASLSSLHLSHLLGSFLVLLDCCFDLNITGRVLILVDRSRSGIEAIRSFAYVKLFDTAHHRTMLLE
jgi:hypothetical protein